MLFGRRKIVMGPREYFREPVQGMGIKEIPADPACFAPSGRGAALGPFLPPYKLSGVKRYSAHADMHNYRPCLVLLPMGRSGYGKTWVV